MLSVALTGNIASGKSIVAELFRHWGATVIDADALVRELQGFRVSYSTAGNAIFGAREGAHDDLVLAASPAIFGATRAEPMMESGFQWIPGRGLTAA